MDMEDLFILMEVIMKDNLKKVRQKDLENMFGQMAKPIQVNRNKIKKMGSEKIFTAMDIMRENLSLIKEKEMGHSLIIYQGQYLKANGNKIKNTEKAN